MVKQTPFQIYLTGEISSNSNKALTLSQSKNLGILKKTKVIYTTYEAFYLFQNSKAEIVKNKKVLSETQIIKEFSKKDKEFHTKYLVFEKLKSKGYIVKTALKFGGEFRVYEKSQKHAKYIVHIVKTKNIPAQEFVAKNRIANSTAKKLLIAIVDEEQNILFYETNWLKIK